MQRYHISILILGIVSAFVLFLVLTQRAPYLFNETTDSVTVIIDQTAVMYLVTSLFLALFSWGTLIVYTGYRLTNKIGHPRLQTRSSMKISFLLATGVSATVVLQVMHVLTWLTGILLWLTLTVIGWSIKSGEIAKSD
ncbi:hypothetical protein KC573_01080 [candidate division WWE3 bacterium]|uniref:Uncharacterized protein n=1 Tax=candidate division WWE3 bacterium TaxID=2053526 RepID=A0A955LWA3_UNCKA|nr:hypothetical protein [candidate division WWE3 bacterium]